MATLIKTTEDLKKYASTAFNFTFENISPYVKMVERDHVKAVIGEDLYDAWSATAPTDPEPLKVYELVREASANLALFIYTPIGSVNIGDNGILIATNSNSQPATWYQIRDLQRSLVNLGFSALDEALKILEANQSDFPEWVSSDAYSVFKELVVPKTSDFDTYFNINKSRRTFMALRPYQLEVQNQIYNWLDQTTFDQIIAAGSDKEKKALELMQAAQVNHTVAKAAESTIFEFTPTGLFVRTLELPGEKTQAVDPEVLRNFVIKRQQAADEHLKLLRNLIESNTDVFTSWVEDTSEIKTFTYNTKSAFSL